MSCRSVIHALVLFCAGFATVPDACAQNAPPSANITGMQGLNITPTARMDEAGTMRAGVSTLDPYNHAFLGFQIAKPLYINLRQSMLVSSIGDKPSRVYPGMDVKLRLREEGRYAPAVAFGMNSLIGHKRFSSEYVALSKRYYDFDFTAGAAWGRLGSAGHIKNPLSRLSSHFDRDRDFSSEHSAGPDDWFTGKEIGFFGGVEYHTPLKGLSLKADFNADAYSAESRAFGFEKPSPWSVGFNYSPKDWVSFGASVVGADKIMARLTFQTNPFEWDRKSYKDVETMGLSGDRPATTWKNLPRDVGKALDVNLGKTRVRGVDFSGVLYMNDYQPAAMQIGRAARLLAGNAGPGIETITIIPVRDNLRGKAVTMSLRDLEQAMARNQGSPEEIWQDTSFSTDTRSTGNRKKSWQWRLAPELSLSVGEEETSHLYRASFLIEEEKQWKYGIFTGSGLRINGADNLHRIARYRDVNTASIRGDADLFTLNRVNMDRAFIGFMRTPLPDFHFALTAGYLEEMYSGVGGEVLYRPFGSAFAVGAEAWKVAKRDALTPLALGVYDQSYLTGHLNLYYDIPDTDITTFVKAGRFIGGDVGVNAGAQMHMDNGMKMKAYITATNADNKDVFGSDRNVIAGVQLSVPFGDLPFIPQGSEARVKIAPIGRDDGAMVDKPVDLYEVTEPMSYRRLGRSWQGVLD